MAASHVFICEPAWNPGMELQAVDRCAVAAVPLRALSALFAFGLCPHSVDRIGQTKPTFIKK